MLNLVLVWCVVWHFGELDNKREVLFCLFALKLMQMNVEVVRSFVTLQGKSMQSVSVCTKVFLNVDIGL